MDFETILARLKVHFPATDAPAIENGDRFAVLPVENSLAALQYLKDDPDLAFDNLMMLAGVDTGRELWVTYALHSLKHRHRLLAKVLLPREQPEVESISGIWGGANFFEREAYDLYGIIFKHHPDLRRLLNPPDWEGWPGRKDYQFPREYHGVPTARDEQYFDETVAAELSAREKSSAPAAPVKPAAQKEPPAGKGQAQ